MESIIQILKLNDLKSGVSRKTGNPYEMQDAECLLLKEDGSIDQVGVLQVQKSLRDKALPGVYTGSFALHSNFASRRIEAVLTDLTPVPPGTYGTPKAPNPAKQA